MPSSPAFGPAVRSGKKDHEQHVTHRRLQEHWEADQDATQSLPKREYTRDRRRRHINRGYRHPVLPTSYFTLIFASGSALSSSATPSGVRDRSQSSPQEREPAASPFHFPASLLGRKATPAAVPPSRGVASGPAGRPGGNLAGLTAGVNAVGSERRRGHQSVGLNMHVPSSRHGEHATGLGTIDDGGE